MISEDMISYQDGLSYNFTEPMIQHDEHTTLESHKNIGHNEI